MLSPEIWSLIKTNIEDLLALERRELTKQLQQSKRANADLMKELVLLKQGMVVSNKDRAKLNECWKQLSHDYIDIYNRFSDITKALHANPPLKSQSLFQDTPLSEIVSGPDPISQQSHQSTANDIVVVSQRNTVTDNRQGRNGFRNKTFMSDLNRTEPPNINTPSETGNANKSIPQKATQSIIKLETDSESDDEFDSGDESHLDSDSEFLVESVSRDRRLFRCGDCTKSYTSKASLTYHSYVHSGNYPWRCSQCQKGFGRQYNLTLHMRVHSGEKPFECTYCQKKFSRKAHMQKHMRNIHSHVVT